MSKENFQFIRIGGKDVFLVFTEQEGSDFTFYLRNDDDAQRVRQVLQKLSNKASHFKHPQSSDTPPESTAEGAAKADAPGTTSETDKLKGKLLTQTYKYSCSAHILKPLLEKVDFNKIADFLNKLKDAVEGKAADSRYDSLKEILPETCKQFNKLNDKELLKTLFKELNQRLKNDENDKLNELFETFSVTKLGETESEILKQVTAEKSKKLLGNYFRLCALLPDDIKPLARRVRDGRVLAGLSYKGQIWSLSFRKQESEPGYKLDKATDVTLNSIKELCYSLYEEIFYAVNQSEETAAGKDGQGIEKKESEICNHFEYLRKIIKHKKKKLSEISGLIVVAGSTNSAKSLITRSLIQLYLENVIDQEQERLPHLVTFEDPIEKYYADGKYVSVSEHPQFDVTMSAAGKKIDYTPRQQGIDAKNLQQALRDALRQTPKVFFVGETRDPKDWRELINFAGTGHLVITTAHASSLVEAMHKIFLATGAKTPADRSEVAGRLLAVVHLKRTEIRTEIKTEIKKCGVLVPAVWRRVARGLNALTSEGLASVLPHSYSDEENPCSCVGRKYFAKKLLKLAQNHLPADIEDFEKRLILQAIDWDLQGA